MADPTTPPNPGGNRSDLVMDPARAPGQLPADAHGQKAARQEAMAAVPAAGGRGSMYRPSERPNEPVTAGQRTGPGAPPVRALTEYDRLKAAYMAYPSEPLRRALEVMERAEARRQRMAVRAPVS